MTIVYSNRLRSSLSYPLMLRLLSGDEFRAMLSQYTTIPAENLEAAAAAYSSKQTAPVAASTRMEL